MLYDSIESDNTFRSFRYRASSDNGAIIPAVNLSQLDRSTQHRIKNILGTDRQSVSALPQTQRPDISRGIYLIANTCIVRNDGCSPDGVCPAPIKVSIADVKILVT